MSEANLFGAKIMVDIDWDTLKIREFVTGIEAAFLLEKKQDGVKAPHYIILCPGAINRWEEARELFCGLQEKITSKVICSDRNFTTIVRWLGYEELKDTYSVKSTVTTPAVDVGYNIGQLLHKYPKTTFEFVAFSRYGFIITGAVDRRRICADDRANRERQDGGGDALGRAAA